MTAARATLAPSQFDAHASKLTSSDKPKDRLALVTEVRDAIEVVNTSEYPKFLSAFLPAFGPCWTRCPRRRRTTWNTRCVRPCLRC